MLSRLHFVTARPTGVLDSCISFRRSTINHSQSGDIGELIAYAIDNVSGCSTELCISSSLGLRVWDGGGDNVSGDSATKTPRGVIRADCSTQRAVFLDSLTDKPEAPN